VLSGFGFEVSSKLGQGVFRVSDAEGKEFAAKICEIPGNHHGQSSNRLNRYRQLENEASLLTGPLHDCPGVINVISHRTPTHLILLQHPVGTSLDQIALPIDEKERHSLLLHWGKLSANALNEIHDRGVIHRDIKPENMIVTTDGELFIIDFGVSILSKDRLSLTSISSWVGTPLYGSTNYEAKMPLTPFDDFESLAYSLHALSMGRLEWFRQVFNKGKPSFDELCTLDPMCKVISDLSHTPKSASLAGHKSSLRILSTYLLIPGVLAALVGVGLKIRYGRS
jgi:serine/threonine protein kinase